MHVHRSQWALAPEESVLILALVNLQNVEVPEVRRKRANGGTGSCGKDHSDTHQITSVMT